MVIDREGYFKYISISTQAKISHKIRTQDWPKDKRN